MKNHLKNRTMNNKFRNIKLFSLMILTLSLTSCNDFFIQELEIPRQELDNQLVVHSFISDIDTSLHFKISKNFGLDETFPEMDSSINDATIKLFRQGELVYEVMQNENGDYTQALNQGLIPDYDYKIEVQHPDYDLAFAETKMPPLVMPESVTFKKNFGFPGPNGDEKQNAIEIVFNDPADQVNYYEIQVHKILVESKEIIVFGDTTLIVKTYPDRYFSIDSNFEQGVSGFLLSDQNFNGEKYTIDFLLVSDQEIEVIPVDALKITWNCISKDHYEYSKSLLQYQRTSGFGLFSDPIAVYSNIQNGLGIFSARSSRVIGMEE
jgi:hypothetical protein